MCYEIVSKQKDTAGTFPTSLYCYFPLKFPPVLISMEMSLTTVIQLLIFSSFTQTLSHLEVVCIIYGSKDTQKVGRMNASEKFIWRSACMGASQGFTFMEELEQRICYVYSTAEITKACVNKRFNFFLSQHHSNTLSSQCSI